MKDIFGTALLDYYNGNYSEDLLTETTISEAEVLPIPYLFRAFHEMPTIEQKALELARGRVLDVGCGTGSHSLYLQEKGLQVRAIDRSIGAVTVARSRGVQDVSNLSLLDLNDDRFDTILLLMNGSGIFESLRKLPKYLRHLMSLLTENGQVLVDSSDLIYMFDKDESGGVWVPGDRYYGELQYTIHYKGLHSDPFNWLYLDERRLANYAKASGFAFELIQQGPNYDYLARLTRV